MKVTNSQVTLAISSEEQEAITNLYKAATDMGLNSMGIGDLVRAIYLEVDSEDCRISSIESIEVAIVYNN